MNLIHEDDCLVTQLRCLLLSPPKKKKLMFASFVMSSVGITIKQLNLSFPN